MGLINLIKIKALNSALNSMSEDKIADIIHDFGVKEFGDKVDQYLDGIQRKLARIVYAINQRRIKRTSHNSNENNPPDSIYPLW